MGRMPSVMGALPMPLTTSLTVPSPPAATIVPKPASTARLRLGLRVAGPRVVRMITLRVSRCNCSSRAPHAAGRRVCDDADAIQVARDQGLG